MGTSQQLSSAPRKGDGLDVTAARDLISPRPVSVRPSSNYGGNGPPVVVASHHATRALSRPPPPPAAAFGAMLSPRTYHSSSYRDAALVAAHHGLSAYAQSAVAAAAAASRALTPRSGGGAAAGCSSGAAAASPGRPPPAPRPTQHSAPTPIAYPPTASDFLPSCRAASPSRGALPPSRSTLLSSRGGVPAAPGSPGRGGVDAAAAAAAAAAANHRSGDVATVTVTHNDLWWRGAFDGATELDDSIAGGGGGGGTTRSVSGSTAGAIRVMSPGWGAASPSAYEVDGRPATRGGGPLYDMEGRPTTRGGQRPPSRAQLGQLSQQRPPAHVAPLGGPGWAGMFAGGCGTVSGETTTASGAPYTSPRAPSAGGSLSWSGDAAEPPGSHRRQLVPLPSAAVPVGVAARLGSPSALGVGSPGGVNGVLTSLPLPAPSLTLSPANHNQPQQGLQAAVVSPGQLPPPGSSGSSSSSNSSSRSSSSNVTAVGAGRAQLGAKLGSIAEAPGSPALLPLPPQQHAQRQAQQEQQRQQQQAQDLVSRMDSGTGRKGPREREASFSSLVVDQAAVLSAIQSGNAVEGVTDDSYLSNLDQDTANRVGSGRARLRRSSASSLAAGGSGYRLPGSGLSGDAAGGGAVALGAAGGGSPADEAPLTRPRR